MKELIVLNVKAIPIILIKIVPFYSGIYHSVGQVVYLKVPRRQFYCRECKKYSTEPLDFLEMGRNYTIRYEEYIYDRVKTSNI